MRSGFRALRWSLRPPELTLIWLALAFPLATQGSPICSCGAERPPCEEYWRADVVFVGTVTAMEPSWWNELDAVGARLFSPQERQRLEQIEHSRDDVTEEEGRFLHEKRKQQVIQALRVRLSSEGRKLADRAKSRGELHAILHKHLRRDRGIQFAVTKVLRGDQAEEIEIKTGRGLGGCVYGFEMGREYLVYASSSEETSQLWTSRCTRTRLAAEATEDLDYVRSLPAGPLDGHIAGVVRGEPIDALGFTNYRAEPVSGAHVILGSPQGSRKTVTDSDGSYRFDELPPGEYQVSLEVEGMNVLQPSRQVSLQGGGCSQQDFKAEAIKGRIEGRLLSAEGEPLARVVVETVSSDSDEAARRMTRWNETNERGYFKISRLEPGEYLIGVNLNSPPTARSRQDRFAARPFPPTYYPGVSERAVAQRIYIDRGEVAKGIECKMPPPLKSREIGGMVLWPDGRPARNARVRLHHHRDSFYIEVEFQPAGRDGRFELLGLQGYEYRLSADADRGERQYLAVLEVATADEGPFVMILRQD